MKTIATAFMLLGGFALACPDARAQTYPTKPVTMVVPFPAGGSTGALARILLEPM